MLLLLESCYRWWTLILQIIIIIIIIMDRMELPMNPERDTLAKATAWPNRPIMITVDRHRNMKTTSKKEHQEEGKTKQNKNRLVNSVEWVLCAHHIQVWWPVSSFALPLTQTLRPPNIRVIMLRLRYDVRCDDDFEYNHNMTCGSILSFNSIIISSSYCRMAFSGFVPA